MPRWRVPMVRNKRLIDFSRPFRSSQTSSTLRIRLTSLLMKVNCPSGFKGLAFFRDALAGFLRASDDVHARPDCVSCELANSRLPDAVGRADEDRNQSGRQCRSDPIVGSAKRFKGDHDDVGGLNLTIFRYRRWSFFVTI
nr:hypothetical protein CFP56_57041 [Quercus suber]